MFGGLAKLIAGLNGYSRPGEVAAGFACGVFLWMLPGGNLLWWLFFIFFAFTKINSGAMLLTLLLGTVIPGFLDPVLHRIGFAVLTANQLYPFFTWFISLPLADLTRFNNSLVMGSLILGPVMWLFVWFLMKYLISLYRITIRDKFIRPKLIPWLRRLPIVKYIVRFFDAVSRAAGAVWQ